MATYYSKLAINNNTPEPLASSLFGICNSLAPVSTKQVILPNFDRIQDGVTIHIKFTYGNTAPLNDSFKLKVGASDSYKISNPGGTSSWAAGAVISFTYDQSTETWNVNDGSVSTITIENTYNPSSETGISGKGVAAALQTLGAAARKDVITAISENEETGNADSTDLPTVAAVVDYLASKPDGVRVYRQTTGYNNDYPLLVSRTLASVIGTSGLNGSFSSKVYAMIWNDASKVPTLNPSTGKLKAALFEGSGANLTNINADNINSGYLSSERLESTGAVAGSYGPTAAKSLSHGESFNVPQVTVDEKGRVTSITSRAMRLPADDSSDVLIPYGVCETVPSTAAKSVTLTPDISSTFGYAAGAQILIKFRYANTAMNPTLNIGDGTNTPIYYDNSPLESSMIQAGRTYSFVYDGNYWTLIGDVNTDTWRPVVDNLLSDDANSSLSAAQGKELKRQIDLKTDNLGTVTSIATGLGLVGGPITNAGTIKVKLRNETALNSESINATEVNGRVYAVVVDASGNLAVNVPWTDTNTFVTQTITDTDQLYKILFSDSSSDTTATEAARKALGLQFNPHSNTLLIGTGTLTATQYSGNAATASVAALANEVAWGNITGRPTLTLAGLALGLNDELDHEITAAALRSALGLTTAVRIVGQTTITNGVLDVPANLVPANGDILLAGGKEFLYIDNNWEELGDESSFKVKQTAITDTGLQSAITFISRISQDANGVITVTKTELPYASSSADGIVSTAAQTFAGVKNFMSGLSVGGVDRVEINGASIEGVTLGVNNSTIADTLEIQPNGGVVNFGSTAPITLNIHGYTSFDGNLGFGTDADDGLGDHEHVVQIGGSLAFLSETDYITHMDLVEDDTENIDMFFYPETTGHGYIGKSANRWNSLYLSNSIALGAPRNEKFTVSSDGEITLTGYTSTFVMSSNSDTWTILNNASGEFSITNNVISMTAREDGFEFVSSIYINEVISQSGSYNLYVNGTSLFTGNMWIGATTESTSLTSGAVRIDGGAGIAKNVNIGGKVGIGTTIDTDTTDIHELAIQGSTIIKVKNGAAVYTVAHLDVSAISNDGWLDFFPETTGRGQIGTTTNQWYRAYISDLVSIGTGIIARGSGILDITTATSTINLATTAANGVTWSIKNTSSVFSISNAANSTYIKGTSVQGFEITPRLYINETMGNGNTDNLYVNGRATIVTGLGIGVNSQDNISLAVNDSMEFVHRTNNAVQVLIHTDYYSTAGLTAAERFSFHPHTDKTGFIGIEDHRWYNLYLANLLNISNDNSDSITMTTTQSIGTSQALIRVASASNTHMIDIKTTGSDDTQIKIHTDRLSQDNSVLILDSMSPRIELNSARTALAEENINPDSYDWVIANEFGTFNLYNVGNNTISFSGNATGFDFYGPIRIHQSFIIDSILSSRTYTEGAFVVSGGVGIGKNLNVNGSIAGKDQFTLVHEFDTVIDDPNDPIEHTPLVQLYYDSTNDHIYFYPEYIAANNMQGHIGTQSNRWTDLYLGEKVNITHDRDNSIDLTSSGAIITMKANSPIIQLNTTAANAVAWTITNAANTFSIASTNNAEYIMGIPGIGFALEPRIFLNVSANAMNTADYVFDIEPYGQGNARVVAGKINLYLGINTESDYVRQKPYVENAASLVVNNGLKVVQDANNLVDVIVAEAATSLSRLYPAQDAFDNYLGTGGHPWKYIYASNLIDIRHSDASNRNIDEILLTAEWDADGGITASFTSTNATVDPPARSGLILTTSASHSANLLLTTPLLANQDSTFTIYSTNPSIILDSDTATWHIASSNGVFFITTGDGREQFRGVQNNGFNIAKRLYINDTITLALALEQNAKPYHLLVNSDSANNPAYIRFNGQVGIGAEVDYYRSSSLGAYLTLNSYLRLVYDADNTQTDIAHLKYTVANGLQFYPQTNHTGDIGIADHWWNTASFYENVNIGGVIDLDRQLGITLSSYTPNITFAPTRSGQVLVSWHMTLDNGVFTWGDRDEANYIKGSTTGWIINPNLVIGTATPPNNNPYDLYVDGDTYFNGDVVFAQGLSIQDSIKPTDDNQTALGDTDARWAAIYIGNQDHYGTEFLPIFWNSNGLPQTATRIIQCYPFSFATGSNETIVGINDPALDQSTVVIQLTIVSGEQFLSAPITWEPQSKGMKFKTLAATQGIVTGYAIMMRTSTGSPAGQGYTQSSFNMTSWKAMQLVKACGSNDQAIFINNSGVPTAMTYTVNKLYYGLTENSYVTSKHYIDDTTLKINWYTGSPTNGNVTFYVNGTSYFTNQITIADTQQYYIDANANMRLASITIGGSTDKNKSVGDGRGIALMTQTDGTTPEIGLFAGATGTFGTGVSGTSQYAMYLNTKYESSQLGAWVFRATGSTSANVFTFTSDSKIHLTNAHAAGIYWAESADSDSVAVYRTISGNATALVLEASGSSEDYIDLRTPSVIKINGKNAFTDAGAFTLNIGDNFSNINFGGNIIKSNNAIKIFSDISQTIVAFQADSTGLVYASSKGRIGVSSLMTDDVATLIVATSFKIMDITPVDPNPPRSVFEAQYSSDTFTVTVPVATITSYLGTTTYRWTNLYLKNRLDITPDGQSQIVALFGTQQDQEDTLKTAYLTMQSDYTYIDLLTLNNTADAALTQWRIENYNGAFGIYNGNNRTSLVGNTLGFTVYGMLYVGTDIPSTVADQYKAYINGTLYVEGNTTINSQTTINGDLLPGMLVEESVYTALYSLGHGGNTPARWTSLFIGDADTYGSATNPIYWHNGVPEATTFTLSATINASGNTNRIAYYSATNAISGGSIATDGSYMTGISYMTITGSSDVNIVYALAITGKTSVSGNIVPVETKCASLGTTNLKWSAVYIGDDATYGGNTQPIYWNNGVPKALTYTANRLYYSASTTTFVAANHYATETAIFINKVPGPTESITDTLYVNGTAYINGALKIVGDLNPSTTNTYSLGTGGNSNQLRWKSLFIGTANSYGSSTQPIFWDNGVPKATTSSVGDAYTPMYLNQGTLTAVTPVICMDFTIASGKYGIRLNHAAFTANSWVIQIVVKSGEANLNAPLQWESDTGYIDIFSQNVVSGAVEGYIYVSRGAKLTATSTSAITSIS